MSLTIYEWRIYCTTENTWKYVWGPTAPTTCPTDTAHSVNLDSISDINVLSTQTVKIDTSGTPANATPVNNYFRLETVIFDAPANTVTTESRSFAYPISLFSGRIRTDEAKRGDSLTIEIGNGITVGALTAGALTGAMTVTVSVASLQFLAPGFFIHIIDSGTLTPTGPIEIVSVNTNTQVVTLSTSLPIDCDIGSTFSVIRRMCRSLEFTEPGIYSIGTTLLQGRYLPASVPVNFIWTNSSVSDDRHVVIELDLFY